MKLSSMLNVLYFVFTPEDSSEKAGTMDKMLAQGVGNAIFHIFKTIFWINIAIWSPLLITAVL